MLILSMVYFRSTTNAVSRERYQNIIDTVRLSNEIEDPALMTNRDRKPHAAPTFKEKYLKLSDFIETIFFIGVQDSDTEMDTVEKVAFHALKLILALQEEVNHEPTINIFIKNGCTNVMLSLLDRE